MSLSEIIEIVPLEKALRVDIGVGVGVAQRGRRSLSGVASQIPKKNRTAEIL